MKAAEKINDDGVELLVAVDVLLALWEQASVVSGYIAAARAEGRKRLTKAEWADIQQSQSEARADLVDAIANAPEEKPANEPQPAGGVG